MFDEIHIAGLIVAVSQPYAGLVRGNLTHLPGTIVHAMAPDGRMVVTVETDSTEATLDCMDAIRALPGVLDVALVYQHNEPAAAMEEVIV